jgi:hypothetical protein
MAEILRVSPEGEFIWHEDADRLIETEDFSNNPGMQHFLRQLRRPGVQVSPLEFVNTVSGKENLVGQPAIWAEWPCKEKNNG